MKLRLTDLAVKKLSPPLNGQVTYWDETTPGFGIRCSSKCKSYVVMYGQKRQLKTLGRFPAMSLSDARKRAKVFLSTYALSPSPDMDHDYEFVVQAYLEDCEGRVRPNTMKGYRLYLEGITFSGPIEVVPVFRTGLQRF